MCIQNAFYFFYFSELENILVSPFVSYDTRVWRYARQSHPWFVIHLSLKLLVENKTELHTKTYKITFIFSSLTTNYSARLTIVDHGKENRKLMGKKVSYIRQTLEGIIKPWLHNTAHNLVWEIGKMSSFYIVSKVNLVNHKGNKCHRVTTSEVQGTSSKRRVYWST